MTNKFQIPNSKFKKTAKVIFVALAIVFLGVGCSKKTDIVVQNQESTSKESTQSKIDPKEAITKIQKQNSQVSFLVEGVDKTEKTITISKGEVETPLQVLEIYYKIETKDFSGIVGKYVVSINGIKENSGKNFWAMYVNGQQAKVGASDYKLKQGDKIVWKLEEIK